MGGFEMPHTALLGGSLWVTRGIREQGAISIDKESPLIGMEGIVKDKRKERIENETEKWRQIIMRTISRLVRVAEGQCSQGHEEIQRLAQTVNRSLQNVSIDEIVRSAHEDILLLEKLIYNEILQRPLRATLTNTIDQLRS